MNSSSPTESFYPDRSGREYLLLDRTTVSDWRDLQKLLKEINGTGHVAIAYHFQAAADVPFAQTWNRIVRQYTSKTDPVSGVRMRRLVARCVAELNSASNPAGDPKLPSSTTTPQEEGSR